MCQPSPVVLVLAGTLVTASMFVLYPPGCVPSWTSTYSARVCPASSTTREEPRHVYIDCTWANSFPPPLVVKFRSEKLWQWHTWLRGSWPRKAFVFGATSDSTPSLTRKEIDWSANSTLGQVAVFKETRIGTEDGPGRVSLVRLLLEETVKADYVVVKIDMRGMERHLFTWLASTPALDLVDAIYYEDSPESPFVAGLETFRRHGARVVRMRVDGASDVLHSLHPDRYAACAAVNREEGRGFVRGDKTFAVSREGHTGEEAWRMFPTPIAGYDLSPWYEPRRKHSFKEVPGRFAVVTAVAVLGSSRNDAPKGSGKDLQACSLITHYLAFKEFGGFLDSDPVDYVVVHSGVPEEVLERWRKFGIKTVKRTPPSAKLWEPFKAGSLFKLHAVGLTEYSRVLVIDSDMYISSSIRDAFLFDYEEDFVTHSGPSSPLAGNFMLVRPSQTAYELLLDLVDNNKFERGRGWNPDDPRSGLFVWPEGPTMCTEPWRMGQLQSDKCQFMDEYWKRCNETRSTTWMWSSAGSDQGIFLYVFNISGLGSTRWITRADRFRRGHISQGLPHFRHFQALCKPHIIAGRFWLPPPKDCIEKGVDWFWDSAWTLARGKYELATECPSFEKYSQARNKMKRPA